MHKFTIKTKTLLILSVITIFFLFLPNIASACDDTLVLLLTSQNPNSVFSKSIRNFMSSLTTLGTALKYTTKDSYQKELSGVLSAWLNFSQNFMLNPPQEAKNDIEWRKKMTDAGRQIAQIRRNVANKKYDEAHNGVLSLSSYIGVFFEGFGLSDDNKLFVETSAFLVEFEKKLINKQFIQASEDIPAIKTYISKFVELLPETQRESSSTKLSELTVAVQDGINKKTPFAKLDSSVQALKSEFETVRAKIKMNEWFLKE